jgi:inorganic pyrophosphatase/manganese-dependent inorganic pyrophosphatase
MKLNNNNIIITAGSTYLDIDAYACIVAMAELLNLRGMKAIAYSNAPLNYSVCASLIEDTRIVRELLPELENNANYIIVDVSDPEFLKSSVPLDKVVEIYDHHIGFEQYWTSRIGEGAHIEFIGAAATLVYRKWKSARLTDKMTPSTARLLVAAILDNTLNLTSKNTTAEDIEAFHELCKNKEIDENFCTSYFSEVQTNVEADLKNAIFKDIKTVRDNPILPPKVAQLCVWDSQRIIYKLPEIRALFTDSPECFMINIIDIKYRCSFFVCDDKDIQTKLERVFEIRFDNGVAKTNVAYLRKEIIKKTLLT